jgi:hypothetical protein
MSVVFDPISSTILAPYNQAPASQKLTINNPAHEPLRLRFRVSYSMNGAPVTEQDEFSL